MFSQPPQDNFSKGKGRKEIETLDKEISDVKSLIQEAVKGFKKSTFTNPHVTTKNLKSAEKFIDAINAALQRVPGQNILDCMIKIKEITTKYRTTE